MKNNGEYLSASVLPYANFKQDICETTKAFANLNYTIVDFHVLIFETNFLQIGTKIGRFWKTHDPPLTPVLSPMLSRIFHVAS